jgi:hypothetical protein
LTFLFAIITLSVITMGMCLKTPFPLLHLALVLQLIFLSLGVIKSMNPLLSSVTEFSPIKGLRSTHIYFSDWVGPNEVTSYNIQVLGYVTSFFSNMNIMLFMQFAMMMTTGALFLMSKKDINLRSAFKVCQRELMLLVFFSAMNIAFSVGLFVNLYPFEVLIAGLSVGILCYQVYYFLKNLRNYYGIEETFDIKEKTERRIKIFILATLIARVSCALLICLFKDMTVVSCCLIVAVQLVFATGFTWLKPYTRSLNNRMLVVA